MVARFSVREVGTGINDHYRAVNRCLRFQPREQISDRLDEVVMEHLDAVELRLTFFQKGETFVVRFSVLTLRVVVLEPGARGTTGHCRLFLVRADAEQGQQERLGA